MKRAMDGQIGRIREHVQEILDRPGSHGMDHVLRVVHLCEIIGGQENADMRVLVPAALLHDIARPAEEETGVPHEEEGARMADEYLRSISYADHCIPAILHAIRAHRYSSGPLPDTLEARILSDADKLDAMGAAGLARTFIRAGEHHGEISDAVGHVNAKLMKLHGLMYTGTAKKIAEERHRFLCLFMETLAKETALPDNPVKKTGNA